MKVTRSKPIYLESPYPWGSQASLPLKPWSTCKEFPELPEGPYYLPPWTLKASLKIPPSST